MKKSASLSGCGRFRYTLTRAWGPGPTLAFVMLNPSTADASIDDPTIRKCIGFARRNGFGGIEVYNLFAYRATDPKELATAGYRAGAGNYCLVAAAAGHLHRVNNGSKVVCAWGANARKKQVAERAGEMRFGLASLGIPLHYLKLTADGIPCHPLMLPYSCAIQEWVIDQK